MIIRTTARLAKALRIKSLAPVETAPNVGPLDEWYANLIVASGKRLVVLMHAQTFLVSLSRNINALRLVNELPSRLCRLLGQLGIPDETAAAATQALGSPVFAKTNDRRCIGTLNEVCFQCANVEHRYGLDDHGYVNELELILSTLVHPTLPDTYPVRAMAKLLSPMPAGVSCSRRRELAVRKCVQDVVYC